MEAFYKNKRFPLKGSMPKRITAFIENVFSRSDRYLFNQLISSHFIFIKGFKKQYLDVTLLMASINTSSTPTNVSIEHSTNEKAPISFLKFSPSSVDISCTPFFRFSISVPENNRIMGCKEKWMDENPFTHKNNWNFKKAFSHLQTPFA